MSLLCGLRAGIAERAALRYLRRLQEDVGHPALRAAARHPGLVALIDQHAAAVRDMLCQARHTGDRDGSAPARTARLAAYARSLVDDRRRTEACPTLPDPRVWGPRDWTLLRLVAVCQLAAATWSAPDGGTPADRGARAGSAD